MTTETHRPDPHTLRGWRALISSAAPKPDRISSSNYADLDDDARLRYDDTRLDHHSAGTTIKTPLVDRLTKEARVLLASNRRQVGAGQGIMVSGPPTTGKDHRACSHWAKPSNSTSATGMKTRTSFQSRTSLCLPARHPNRSPAPSQSSTAYTLQRAPRSPSTPRPR